MPVEEDVDADDEVDNDNGGGGGGGRDARDPSPSSRKDGHKAGDDILMIRASLGLESTDPGLSSSRRLLLDLITALSIALGTEYG